VVTALLAAVAFVLGAMSELSAGPAGVVPTADQQAVLDDLGAPPAWVLVEATDEPDSARYEQWFFADDGQVVTFLAGATHGQLEVTVTEDQLFDVRSPVSPVDLDRSMTPADVDAVVDGTGMQAEPWESDLGTVTTFVYPDAGLVVQFLDGRLYTAVTV
jgi:hypothetical protein